MNKPPKYKSKQWVQILYGAGRCGLVGKITDIEQDERGRTTYTLAHRHRIGEANLRPAKFEDEEQRGLE